MKHYDLAGQRFGRLVAVKMVGKASGGTALWECICDCGKKHIVRSASLRNGDTQSCGCLHREGLVKRNTVHSHRDTRLYGIWNKIKDRCFNPNCKRFSDYGGRGITVCREWKDSFQAFFDWAMENGYKDSLTIDRKDPNGNYEPTNCRWSTYKEQGNNKRNNRLITVHGKTHTVGEWASIVGIKYSTLYSRIYRNGMNTTEAENLIAKYLEE